MRPAEIGSTQTHQAHAAIEASEESRLASARRARLKVEQSMSLSDRPKSKSATRVADIDRSLAAEIGRRKRRQSTQPPHRRRHRRENAIDAPTNAKNARPLTPDPVPKPTPPAALASARGATAGRRQKVVRRAGASRREARPRGGRTRRRHRSTDPICCSRREKEAPPPPQPSGGGGGEGRERRGTPSGGGGGAPGVAPREATRGGAI